MRPVLTEINETAFKPYTNQEITQEVALERSSDIIKRFMLKQTSKNDLGLFVSLSGMETPIKEEDIPKLPLTIVIPAFIISELTIAFKIGFLIFKYSYVHGYDDASSCNDISSFQDIAVHHGGRMESYDADDSKQFCYIEWLCIILQKKGECSVLYVAAPMLGLSLLVGLAVSIFQATTQIQEQTLIVCARSNSNFWPVDAESVD